MMEALSSSETSVLIRVTRRNIPGDVILHSHRRENLETDFVSEKLFFEFFFRITYDGQSQTLAVILKNIFVSGHFRELWGIYSEL
jgi:hypothetical protein